MIQEGSMSSRRAAARFRYVPVHGQRYAALSAPNPLTPSFLRHPYVRSRPRPHFGRSCVEIWYYWRQCNRCNCDHAYLFADQCSVAGGVFLKIKAGGDRVSDICGAIPPTLESPVQLGKVMALSRPNSTPQTQHTGHSSDLFLFIFASVHIFWVDLTYTLKWQLGKSVCRDCTRSE